MTDDAALLETAVVERAPMDLSAALPSDVSADQVDAVAAAASAAADQLVADDFASVDLSSVDLSTVDLSTVDLAGLDSRPAVTEPTYAPVHPPRVGPILPVALPVSSLAGLGAGLATGVPFAPMLIVCVVWLLVALQLSPARLVPGARTWQGLLSASTASVATAGVVVGLLDAPRHVVAASLVLVLVGTLTAAVLRQVRGVRRRRIVVVGGGADVAAAAARWLGHDQVEVVGAVLTGDESDLGHRRLVDSLAVPVTHGADDLGRMIDETTADLVVVAPSTDEATLRQLSWQVERRSVGLAVSGALDSVSPHRLQIAAFAGSTLTHVARSRPSMRALLAKSALDRLVGVALLVAAAPMLAVLAVLIRLDSAGPVFFRQTRVGHHGRLFTMWKLRTMCVEAEEIKASLATSNEGAGVLFKMQADPRITRVGRVLRKLSLDELPQLINVVLGHMSLVGPRPALPKEVAAYDVMARRRLAAKPGITGLWQVSGRSDLSWEDTVRLDLHYTDNWRIRDDASILFRTAGAVLNSRGAY